MQIVRRCCYCEKEFALKPIPEASHGICFRHQLERYSVNNEDGAYLREIGVDVGRLIEKNRLAYAQNPLTYSPDYSQVFDG